MSDFNSENSTPVNDSHLIDQPIPGDAVEALPLPPIGSLGRVAEISLFDSAVLLQVSASVYSGQIGQDEEDLKVQGVDAPPAEGDVDSQGKDLFIPGHKRLIRKEALEPFKTWRGQVNAYLQQNSMPFMDFSGCRLVRRDRIRAVLDRLEGFKSELLSLVDAFMGMDNSNYVVEQNIQSALFDQRYPSRAGHLTQYFLPPGTVRAKFGLKHKIGELTSVRDAYQAGLTPEEIATQQAEIQSFGEVLRKQARQDMFKHLGRMVKAMTPKNGRIGENYVAGLVEQARELKNRNVSDDPEVNAMIDSVITSAFNVKNWKADEEQKRALMAELESIMRTTAPEIGADPDAFGIITRRHVRPAAADAVEVDDKDGETAPVVRRIVAPTPEVSVEVEDDESETHVAPARRSMAMASVGADEAE